MLGPGGKHRLRSHCLGVLVICAGCIATPTSADAQQPPPIELEWTAPRECPNREAVLRIVLSRSTERRAVVPLRAHAKIIQRGTNYRLDLALDHQAGSAHRSLESSRCAPLAEAAAVLIVLAMDTEREGEPDAAALEPAFGRPALLDGPEDSPTSAGAPIAVVTAANSAADDSPQTAPSDLEDRSLEITQDDPSEVSAKRTLRLQLSAAARADFGTFPHQPAFGMQVQLAARIRPLYVALGATFWPAREQHSVSYPNARLRGSGVFGEVGVGLDLSTKPLVLTPALNVELGVLYAEATGIAGPERNPVLWFAFGPSLSAAFNVLTDFWLALDVAGLIPAYQTHWLVRTPEGDVPAFDAAPIVLRIAVRIGYNFL